MDKQDFKRKLTAVFSADVAGYSRLMGQDEAATVMTLESYKQVMFTLIKQHRGRVIDSPGDNLLAEFASVVDAVQCAVAVQKELQARNAELPDNRKMRFRIGINLGDVIEEGERLYGDGVNIAARLEALADPGGICVSKTAFDHIESKLPLGYQFLGEQTVKNIARPVGAYKVLMEPRVTMMKVEEKNAPSGKRRFSLAIAVIVVLLVGVLAVWQFLLKPSPPAEEKVDPKKAEAQLLAQLEAQKQAAEQAQRAIEEARREAALQAQKLAAEETLRRAQEERSRLEQDRKRLEKEKQSLEEAKQRAAAATAATTRHDGTYSGQLCNQVPNKEPLCWTVPLKLQNGVAEGNWISRAQKPAKAMGTVAPDGSFQLNLDGWTPKGDPVKATLVGRMVDGTITASGRWSGGDAVTGEWKRTQAATSPAAKAAPLVAAANDGSYTGQFCIQLPTKQPHCWPVALVVQNGIAEGNWIHPSKKPARTRGTVAPDGSVKLKIESWNQDGTPAEVALVGRIVDGTITASGQSSRGFIITGDWKRTR